MKTLRQHLEKLRQIKRSQHHPLIYTIHKKHKLSKRTLFYVKEYGPHSHVAKTILKESIKILLLASLFSSFGGFTLEHIKPFFVKIMPLIIMLPILNGMIGNYGIVVSSKFSTMLHEGKIRGSALLNRELRILFIQILLVSIITVLISAVFAAIATKTLQQSLDIVIALKMFLIVLADVLLLVVILFITSVVAGIHFYRKKEDPNNFLIPITTSIADFFNMALLSLLVVLFF